MLSKRQSTIQGKINKLFNDECSIIHLYGPEGGGKTTLVKEYADFVGSKLEDWSVYYIEGKKNTMEAYATITLAEGISRRKYESSGFSLNLGFRISQFFNVGVTGVFQKKPELDPKVNFVLNDLRKNPSSNILIVADSYQYWDTSSKSFLMTLKNYQKKLLDQKRLKLLLVTDGDTKEVSQYIDFSTPHSEGAEFEFDLPGVIELREVLSLLGHSNLRLTDEDLDIIMSITGGHLEAIKLFIEGYYYSKQGKLSNDTSLIDMMKLLEYRIESLGQKSEDISDVLQASSILNGDFKAEQIKFLLKDKKDIDVLLKVACKTTILKKSNNFIFSNLFIQRLFYKKLEQSDRNFEFQVDYANYLKENEPENYAGRAYYLSLGDQNNERIIEIIELFALAYCRNIESSTVDAESKEIESLIKKKVDSCSHNYEVRALYNNFLNLKTAYEFYFQENYKEADSELNKISSFSLTGQILLMSEIKRMKLVIALMINMNTENIRRLTTDLQDSLMELKENEKEQWFKSAFTLFSTYSNKLNDFDQSEHIVNELLTFINDNKRNKLFEYMGKIISRKACVFKHPTISKQYTADSIAYFEQREDQLQYYFALCNHSGNLLAAGEYKGSEIWTRKCLELISEYPHIQFPSHEKIYNNLILASFFRKYRKNFYLDESLISDTIAKFEKKISDSSRESNAILYLNIINLYVMKGEYRTSDQMLRFLQNTILENNEDSFYRYHIISVNLAMSIQKQLWDVAAEHWKELTENFPNFYKKNEDLIQKRNKALKKLIENKISLPPDQLDNWVYKNSNSLDNSGDFYCRLFLFSDLQFTSI